jgi:hypothetical protein
MLIEPAKAAIGKPVWLHLLKGERRLVLVDQLACQPGQPMHSLLVTIACFGCPTIKHALDIHGKDPLAPSFQSAGDRKRGISFA